MIQSHAKLRPTVTYTLEHRVSAKGALENAIAPAIVPVSFSPAQLDKVMTAARSLPVESRDSFLRLIAEQLKLRDIDVVDAIDRALRYMNHAA